MNDDLVKGKSFVLLEYLQGFEPDITSGIRDSVIIFHSGLVVRR